MAETRKGYTTIEQQLEADKRYRKKNKEHRNYLSARSSAKSFIRNKATSEDIEDLRYLLDDRESTLKDPKHK